jgi:hypothetical protein
MLKFLNTFENEITLIIPWFLSIFLLHISAKSALQPSGSHKCVQIISRSLYLRKQHMVVVSFFYANKILLVK